MTITMGMMRRIAACLVLMWVVLFGPALLAQAMTNAQTAVAMAGTTQANEWGGSIVWAFLSTSALEWIKRKPKLTMITEKTGRMAQRAIGIVLAVLTAVGVHWTYDVTAGRLVVEGLTLAMVGEAVRQFVFNEITYRLAVKDYGKENQS